MMHSYTINRYCKRMKTSSFIANLMVIRITNDLTYALSTNEAFN